MTEDRANWKRKVIGILLLPVLLLIAVLSAISFPFIKLFGQWLKYRFWQRHGKFGKFILFVYSDSPNWKEYIEDNMLPRIEKYAVLLNWSQRKEWHKTHPLEARIFNHWAGRKEFNPMAILLSPRLRVKQVRFWKAFKDFKHGKEESLREAEDGFFDEVEKIRQDRGLNVP
jgi:hypothetical protein